jgi:hypothetical protein
LIDARRERSGTGNHPLRAIAGAVDAVTIAGQTTSPLEEVGMTAGYEMSTAQRSSPWAQGLIVLAGAIMVIAGVFQVFAGTAALVRDKIYVGTPQYLYAFDLTVWGWIQLLTGVLSVAAGYALLRGQMWARIVGVVLAGLSMVTQFMFIPHYPIWSLLVIALDTLIIFGLITYRREAQ